MKKRLIFINLLLVSLLVFVSYAWMSSDTIPSAKHIIFQYDDKTTIGVESDELYLDILIYQDGKYQELDSSNPSVFTSKNMVPSDAVDFILRFTNPSETTIQANLFFTNIVCSDPKVLDVFYVALNKVEGYPLSFTNKPQSIFKAMSEDIILQNDNTYKMPFVQNLRIPSSKNGTLDLYCYFLYDRLATLEYANLSLVVNNVLVVL